MTVLAKMLGRQLRPHPPAFSPKVLALLFHSDCGVCVCVQSLQAPVLDWLGVLGHAVLLPPWTQMHSSSSEVTTQPSNQYLPYCKARRTRSVFFQCSSLM